MKGLKELRDIVLLLDAIEASQSWTPPHPSEAIFQKALFRRRRELMDACICLWNDPEVVKEWDERNP